MTLAALIQELPELIACRGDAAAEIGELTADSRKAMEKGLFFRIVGQKLDAHDFAGQAIQNGCAALVVERLLPGQEVPQVLVSDARAAMARIAAAFYGHPARRLKLLGVTGTKGKTTATYLIKAICEQAGYSCGLIGTTGNMFGKETL